MNTPTLIVLAAGMGSRYGGLKQIDPFGPNGETIIEYSIYDAIDAGFGKVVFVIRKAFHEAFQSRFATIFEGKIEVAYAFQEIDSPVEGIDKLPERTKPWGTAHAVMVAEPYVNGPFAVINADDYYGQDGFKHMAQFLEKDCKPDLWAMVGYELDRTLSDHGTVNRGIAMTDDDNHLIEVHERLKIKKENGNISYLDNEKRFPLKDKDIASMNFFGFHPYLFEILKIKFKAFVKANLDNPTAEFFIPFVVNEAIQEGTTKMKVLPCKDSWFGVTYPDDKPIVQAAFVKLIDSEAYPTALW